MGLMRAKMMRYRQHGWELKSYEADGTFEGYASVFETVDHHQDQVVPGAFQKSLATMRERQYTPKMLWQHDTQAPIGVWMDLREDGRGLWVKGRILLDLQKGKEAYTLLKEGVVDALSIGFRIIKALKGDQRLRRLEEIDLIEVSLVTFGANPHARVSYIKTQESTQYGLFVARLQEIRRQMVEESL